MLLEPASLVVLMVGGTGGNVWESNPPRMVLAPNTGFEVREGHQSPCAPAGVFTGNKHLAIFSFDVKYPDF